MSTALQHTTSLERDSTARYGSTPTTLNTIRISKMSKCLTCLKQHATVCMGIPGQEHLAELRPQAWTLAAAVPHARYSLRSNHSAVQPWQLCSRSGACHLHRDCHATQVCHLAGGMPPRMHTYVALQHDAASHSCSCCCLPGYMRCALLASRHA